MAAYSYPITEQADTGGPQRLHPDYVKDSTKLCMYKAMSGAALGDAEQFKTVIEVTKPLRRTFMVPFDDDIWALVLAYLYDFRLLGTYTTLSAATSGCEGAAIGDRMYISIGATDPSASGHAIYAVKGASAVTYHDNEYASDTSRINPKFRTGFTFLVFKRAGLASSAARGLSYRIAYMPASMVETLLQAHVAYGHFTIGWERADAVTRDTLSERYSKRIKKMKWTLKSVDGLNKQISDWDRAMPKAS